MSVYVMEGQVPKLVTQSWSDFHCLAKFIWFIWCTNR